MKTEDEFSPNIVAGTLINHQVRASKVRVGGGFKRQTNRYWGGFPEWPFAMAHCPLPSLLGDSGDAVEVSAWECYNPISKRWYSNFDRIITWPDQRPVKLQIAFDITKNKQWESERQAAVEVLHQSRKNEALGLMAGAIAHPIDLANFCSQQVADLEKLLPNNIVLETDLSTTGLIIDADCVMLQQILNQLVSNSREALNGRGGAISFSVKLVAAADMEGLKLEPKNWRPLESFYSCLTVSVTGGGIAEDNKGKIFDPFFTTKPSSRGLGLAVVLGAVKASGGAVEVTSDARRGCEVRIFLPPALDKTVPRKI